MKPYSDFAAFRTLSATLGSDPLRVQGLGGNTSIKDNDVMCIKASGTELADAETTDIFVAVDLTAARAPAHGAGDGNPRAILIEDSGIALRNDATPSQRAMLRFLSDVLLRLPKDWSVEAIGPNAEAKFLNWDAEKYRQALVART